LKNDISRKRLHMWRKQVPIFREMVTETLEQALPAAARLTSRQPLTRTVVPQPSSPMDRKSIITDLNFDEVVGYEDIIPDFKRILAAINDLQDRVDRLTDIVTAEISIEDTKRSLVETHNSARLTWLATVFVPLSLIR
jgi:Mg2+ and Co2+ transporter CorA